MIFSKYIVPYIIIINFAIYLYMHNLASSDFGVIFGLNLLCLKAHFIFQLLTSMFLHANISHICLNMIVLFQFGFLLEGILGKVKFLLLYLLGGMICSLLSLIYIYFFAPNTTIIGASGAICVLMGFYAYYDKSTFKGLLIALLLMSFIPLLMGINVAWHAHLIGFFLGFLCAKINIFKVDYGFRV